MPYKYVKEYRKRIRKRMADAFGGKCGICGYDKYVSALEFHHLDPSKKEFSLKSYTINNWKLIVKELRKCVCVCSNCHKEIHGNVTELPDDINHFDETYAIKETFSKPKFYDDCPVCGKRKNAERKYCSMSCSNKTKEKFNWNDYDVEDMLYRKHMKLAVVARVVGISDNALRKRLGKLGLPYRKKDIEKYIASIV